MGKLIDACSISGVQLHPLKVFRDERGAVMHMLRCDAPHFTGIGEVYFSSVKYRVVKGWKRHREMSQSFAVPVGRVKFVLYDDREASKTKGEVAEVILSPKEGEYCLLRVPPMLWYGFTSLYEGESLICNCASIPHDPEESERKEVNDASIPYRF